MKLTNIVMVFASIFCLAQNVRATLVYVPRNLETKNAKVLVVLHGCLQYSESMSSGTRFNDLAEKNNLVVIYPQVPKGSNGMNCWGWFLPENQTTTEGQLKQVMDEVLDVRKQLSLANERTPVFVAGISSGGATAAGLMACYPNYFSAGAVHSGPSYGLAQSFEESKVVLGSGPGTRPNKGPCDASKFTGSIMVVQGRLDKVVHPTNADRIISDFVRGAEPAKVQDVQDEQGRLLYTRTDFQSPQARGRLIMVPNLGHAWSGTPSEINQPFFSKDGPNATLLMWDYFSEVGARGARDKKKTGK